MRYRVTIEAVQQDEAPTRNTSLDSNKYQKDIASMSSTELTAVTDLLDEINDGTDVSAVVTAIDNL